MIHQHRSRGPLTLPTAVAIGVIITLSLYFLSPLQTPTMAESSPSFLPNLQVTLSPSASDPDHPPSVSVSVKNTSPDTTVTVLKWESPLDPAALGLGQVSVTPAGDSEPIPAHAIKISRKMPPGAESLVTLRPGESADSVVELREPRVPGDVWKAGKARVAMTGRWMAVWPGVTTEELLRQPERLASVGAGAGSLTGEWETESIEIGKERGLIS